MTNEQKAVKLEEMAANREADSRGLHDLAEKLGLTELQKQKTATIAMADADAALLRESAGMMREQGKVQWVKVAGSAIRQMALYRGWILEVDEGEVLWSWSADYSAKGLYGYQCPTLEAAQAAAVAWVDEQEGRDA